MAGNKNSGRRSITNDNIMMSVIAKCWELARKDINDPDLDPAIKREIYSKIIVKNIPSDISAKIKAEVTDMPAIQKSSGEAKDNRISEFIIGSHPNTPQV